MKEDKIYAMINLKDQSIRHGVIECKDIMVILWLGPGGFSQTEHSSNMVNIHFG